jgi:hypothetical protein
MHDVSSRSEQHGLNERVCPMFGGSVLCHGRKCLHGVCSWLDHRGRCRERRGEQRCHDMHDVSSRSQQHGLNERVCPMFGGSVLCHGRKCLHGVCSWLDHRGRSRERRGEQQCHDVHSVWLRHVHSIIDSGMLNIAIYRRAWRGLIRRWYCATV